MRTLIVILTILFMKSGVACKLGPTSEWNQDYHDLVKSAKFVYIGKVGDARKIRNDLYEYQLQVLSMLKGKQKESFSILGSSPLKPSEEYYPYYKKDCRIVVRFEVGGKYLIIHDSNSPKGYQKLLN